MVRNFVLLLDDVFQRGGPHYDRIVDYLQRARRARFFALPERDRAKMAISITSQR